MKWAAKRMGGSKYFSKSYLRGLEQLSEIRNRKEREVLVFEQGYQDMLWSR